MMVNTYSAAEATLSHNTGISAITSTSSLRLEHVVVMTLVVAMSEALLAQWHALGDPTGLAAEGNKVCGPDQATHDGVVVLLNILGEVIRAPASSNQPLAPLYGGVIADIFLGVEEIVHQGLWKSNMQIFILIDIHALPEGEQGFEGPRVTEKRFQR